MGIKKLQALLCNKVRAAEIADGLQVTLDYLIKDGDYKRVDEETLKRLKEIQQLSPENNSHVYALLDAFINR